MCKIILIDFNLLFGIQGKIAIKVRIIREPVICVRSGPSGRKSVGWENRGEFWKPCSILKLSVDIRAGFDVVVAILSMLKKASPASPRVSCKHMLINT